MHPRAIRPCLAGAILIFSLAASARADYVTYAKAFVDEFGQDEHTGTMASGALWDVDYNSNGQAFTARSDASVSIGLDSDQRLLLHIGALAKYDGDTLTQAGAFAGLEVHDAVRIHVNPIDPFEILTAFQIVASFTVTGTAKATGSGAYGGEFHLGDGDIATDLGRNYNGEVPIFKTARLVRTGTFEYAVAMDYYATVSAGAGGANGVGFAEINYKDTIKLLGAIVTDENGNPIPATITSSLGINYSPRAVPEPSSAALLAVGLTAAALAARRRRAGAGISRNGTPRVTR